MFRVPAFWINIGQVFSKRASRPGTPSAGINSPPWALAPPRPPGGGPSSRPLWRSCSNSCTSLCSVPWKHAPCAGFPSRQPASCPSHPGQRSGKESCTPKAPWFWRGSGNRIVVAFGGDVLGLGFGAVVVREELLFHTVAVGRAPLLVGRYFLVAELPERALSLHQRRLPCFSNGLHLLLPTQVASLWVEERIAQTHWFPNKWQWTEKLTAHRAVTKNKKPMWKLQRVHWTWTLASKQTLQVPMPQSFTFWPSPWASFRNRRPGRSQECRRRIRRRRAWLQAKILSFTYNMSYVERMRGITLERCNLSSWGQCWQSAKFTSRLETARLNIQLLEPQTIWTVLHRSLMIIHVHLFPIILVEVRGSLFTFCMAWTVLHR